LKVLIIRSRLIDPNFFKIAYTLKNNGYDVDILVWNRSVIKNIKQKKDFNIKLFNLRAPHDSLSIIPYIPIWIIYEYFYILFNKYDIIQANDFDTIIPVYINNIYKKYKIVYMIYDYYSSNFPSYFPNFIINIFSKIENFFIKNSNLLFLVDPSRLKQVNKNIHNYQIIYNTPNEKILKKIDRKKKNNIFTIFYGGILHSSRGLIDILNIVKKRKDIKIIIAGEGPLKKDIIEYSNKYDNIYYIGFISYNELISYTKNSDLIIALYDPKIRNSQFASPNKLFESMMCGKPIIVNTNTAMSNIVLKEKCGLLVEYGNILDLENAINIIKDNPEKKKILGENGMNAYKMKYNWKLMEKVIVTSYEDLLKKGK